MGDGCTIAGIGKGLAEMRALGFIRRVPRLLGVQAEGARPLVDAFRDGRDVVPGPAQTRGRQHLRRPSAQLAQGAARGARRRTARSSPCPDEAILEAMREAGRRAGVFGEPAGVAGLAGLRQAVEEGIVGRRATALGRGHRQRPQGRAQRAARGRLAVGPAAPDDALAAYLAERPL